jgi:hypothetical protein
MKVVILLSIILLSCASLEARQMVRNEINGWKAYYLVDRPFALDSIPWHEASSWKLYDVGMHVFVRDSLAYYESDSLPADSMNYYLSGVSILPEERTRGAAWMGDYWISGQFRDSTKIFRVSNYGGFFTDVATGKYYVVKNDLRQPWLYMFTRTIVSFQKSPPN